MKSSTKNVWHGKESYYFSTAAGNNPPHLISFGDFYEQLFYSRYEIPHQLLLTFKYIVKFLSFMFEWMVALTLFSLYW